MERTPDGGLQYNFHRGQVRILESTKRIILALAGAQSGKTELGPPWLWQEIRRRGPGDYLFVTPTYPLLNLKALPAFLRLFETLLGLGTFRGSNHVFTFSEEGQRRTWGKVSDEPTRVIFGHASNPESLESATAKGAWLDEAGQAAFRLGSWEAINRRVAVNQGRILITTTPYSIGWLKQLLWDPWEKAKRKHPEIDVVNFKSIENPAFPMEEYERARRDLPAWKFAMFYDGRFETPAGLIYRDFDTQSQVIPRFSVPEHWPRHLGLDFGGVNTAGLFLAEEMVEFMGPVKKWDMPYKKTGRLIAYREYHEGGRIAKEHVKELLVGEPRLPNAVGGAGSEEQWRREFADGGMPVKEPPIRDVEVGIDRVTGTIKRRELIVMEDLAGLLDELASYSRVVDENGDPTEDIENKADFHLLDALRYINSELRGGVIPRGGWKLETL